MNFINGIRLFIKEDLNSEGFGRTFAFFVCCVVIAITLMLVIYGLIALAVLIAA